MCSQLLHNVFTTYSWLFWSCSQLFTIFSILVHDMFRICSFEHQFFMACSLFVLEWLMTCSQHFYNFLMFVHDLFMPCSGLVHSFFTMYSQLIPDCVVLVHNLFSTFSQFFQYMFMTCSVMFIWAPLLHGLFINCSWLVHNLTCSLIVHILFTTWFWLVHELFNTCSLIFHRMFMTCS